MERRGRYSSKFLEWLLLKREDDRDYPFVPCKADRPILNELIKHSKTSPKFRGRHYGAPLVTNGHNLKTLKP